MAYIVHCLHFNAHRHLVLYSKDMEVGGGRACRGRELILAGLGLGWGRVVYMYSVDGFFLDSQDLVDLHVTLTSSYTHGMVYTA